MRSKTTFLVLLIAAQMAYALDPVPKAEYRQRRVKLAAQLHGGSALIVAAHEPPWSSRITGRTRTSFI
jgi:hypothetical protein